MWSAELLSIRTNRKCLDYNVHLLQIGGNKNERTFPTLLSIQHSQYTVHLTTHKPKNQHEIVQLDDLNIVYYELRAKTKTNIECDMITKQGVN